MKVLDFSLVNKNSLHFIALINVFPRSIHRADQFLQVSGQNLQIWKYLTQGR